MKPKIFTPLLFITFLFQFDIAFAQLEKIGIVKKVDYNDKLISKSGLEPLYRMTIGFTDIEGTYHQLPQKFMCEDNEAIYKPCIYFDSLNYYIFVKSLDETFNGYVYKFNIKEGFKKEVVFTNQAMGYVPFFGKLVDGEPTIYHCDRNATSKQIVKAVRNNGNWTYDYTDLDMSAYLKLNRFIKQAQWYKDSYKQFPFKIFNTTDYNPYVPVWCKSDKINDALAKPTIFYEEIPNSKFEIPNMPWIEEQSALGECEAYAIGALFQHWVCSKWKGTEDEIKDCSNPPLESKISYFGLLSKIHRDSNNEFVLSYDDPKYKKNSQSMYYRFERFMRSPTFIIRDSSKPFQNIDSALSYNGSSLLSDEERSKKKNKFLHFLNRIYDNANARINKKNVLDSLYFYTGMETKYFNLEKAFSKKTYGDFTESLFFDGCQYGIFPLGASLLTYPLDFNRKTITQNDLKQKIIDILLIEKKPLTFDSALGIDLNGEPGDNIGHSVVICGYKKVINIKTKEIIELFKIHNSWGEKWQKENNNGWCNAKNLLESAILKIDKDDEKLYFSPYVINFLK